MRLSLTIRNAAAVATLCLLGSCTFPYAVWVIEGSTVANLVFGLATEPHGTRVEPLESLYIEPCLVRWDRAPDERRWHSAAGYGLPIARLTFQTAPADSVVQGTDEPLTAGCYTAHVSASGGRLGQGNFLVDEDGSARDLTPADVEVLFGPRRRAAATEDSIAHTRCAEGYRAARSAADTAAVDAQVWYDTTYVPPSLDCRFVCTTIGPNARGEETKRSRCRFLHYDRYGQGIER